MARGKIQIRRIENSTNRQVTYSKRRNGLFKKANELTVLCDAEVSLIMVSSSGKVHEYISPSTTTKQLLDQYRKTLGIDIWSSHYEAMQEHLKKLKEVNMNLRRQIRQRVGDCLNDLSFDELRGLQEEVEAAVAVIRQRKVRMISNKIDTTKKKVKSQADINMSLHELRMKGIMIQCVAAHQMEEDLPYLRSSNQSHPTNLHCIAAGAASDSTTTAGFKNNIQVNYHRIRIPYDTFSVWLLVREKAEMPM
ncbi:MADS domain class transcription factor [Pyrus ussuriensis x Pyrus communis]|uniref:MADS domain class transcription factor n=1 Tax=Pyrus ussuriensis x Pyrus communis TaxID=2448454 RepID=A0A5N5HJN1_9ROSA|nr:MADS domain class transcription factor [Pyrus ussuriensis x Pyrus communis]